MSSKTFSIVDVFSTTAFKGNPLAIVDNTSNALNDTQMQLIARQFNLSETTFFSRPTDSHATYKLRSFLPDGREVFGAGHHILGVWWYLAGSGRLDLSKSTTASAESGGDEVFTFHQELGNSVSPVRVYRNIRTKKISISLRQQPPGSHAFHPDPNSLATAIHLDAGDIGIPGFHSLQPQVMSTSTTRHLIVPLTSIDALNRAVVDREKLLEQLALVDKKAYGLYLFAKQSGRENTYQARFFSPGMSGEDPATGSAAGPLSAYLYRHGLLRLVNDVGQIRVNQGLRVGRECVISVELTREMNEDGEEGLQVDLLGQGVQIGHG